MDLGGEKLDIGIDYDRNGGTFVNFDGLNGDQRGALQGAVQGKLAQALAGDESLESLVSSGDKDKARKRVDEILPAQGLGGVKLDVTQLVAGSAVGVGSQLKSAQELLDPRAASVAKALTQDGNLTQLIATGDTKGAQDRVNQILKDNGFGNASINVSQLIQQGKPGEVAKLDAGKALSQAAAVVGGTPGQGATGILSDAVSSKDALGSVRSALGGKEAQLTRNQFLQAEGDVIKSFKDSGVKNIKFATTAIQELADNADFQALAGGTLALDKANTYRQQLGLGSNATQADIAKGLLAQAEKSSGLNVGVFQVSELKGKSSADARAAFGSVDLNKGYDGRVSRSRAQISVILAIKVRLMPFKLWSKIKTSKTWQPIQPLWPHPKPCRKNTKTNSDPSLLR